MNGKKQMDEKIGERKKTDVMKINKKAKKNNGRKKQANENKQMDKH